MPKDAPLPSWPGDRCAEALRALILVSEIPVSSSVVPPIVAGSGPQLIIQLVRGALSVGVRADAGPVGFTEMMQTFLNAHGPHIIVLPTSPVRIAAVVFERGTRCVVVAPDGGEHQISVADLRLEILRLMPCQLDSLRTTVAGIASAELALAKLIREGHDGQIGFVSLQPDPASPLVRQIRFSAGWRALFAHGAWSVIRAAAALGAMWTLGSTAIDGRVDVGRVLGWSLLALSDAPLQYLALESMARFARSVSSALKRRLLEGSFFIDERELGKKGFGQLLARANESELADRLTVAEITGLAIGALALIGAYLLLGRGMHPLPMCGALTFAACLFVWLARARIRSYRQLFDSRMDLTEDLVEKIVAHRTRAVQEASVMYHVAEDDDLASYLALAGRADTLRIVLTTYGRAWLLFAGLLLGIGFVVQVPVDRLGWSGLGVMLAYLAFGAMAPAVERLAELFCAWHGIEPLVEAGRQRERGTNEVADSVEDVDLPTVLSMSSVSHSHRPGGRPILSDVDLTVRAGERILLEGASGSGKTTLLKIIAGELRPTAGVVLVGGADVYSVSGMEWRRQVASAPQFHENHVFANSFSFNLGGESEEAIAICDELGLTNLISRMPQGLAQLLGETGWQLSHGERSRLFIARALLQHSTVVLFDESFGALDPETLLRALGCVRARAKTLIVCAHV